MIAVVVIVAVGAAYFRKEIGVAGAEAAPGQAQRFRPEVSTFNGFSTPLQRLGISGGAVRTRSLPPQGLAGILKSAGSDAMNNLMVLWAEGFHKQYRR